MKRQFLRHGLVYGAANLISGAGTVALVPIYTHALQPGEYGVVEYIAVLQILLQIGAGLEITQGLARFYAGAASSEDRRAYASTGFWFLIASFASVCAALYVTAWVFGARSVGLGEGSSLFGFALLSVYVRILFYSLQSQLRWELRSDLYSVASLIAVACTVSLVAYLLLVRHAGLGGVFRGLSAGYGIACVFCLFSLRHTYRWLFDARKFRQMLGFSLPLMFSSLALFFASYGDRLILKSALGFDELGIYGVGARIAAVITLAINGFQLGAAPLIYRHHDEPGAPAMLAQLMRLFLAVGLVGVVSLAAFSVDLLRLFTTPEYSAAWRLIPVLACAMLFANLYIFVPGLAIRNLTRRFAIINVGTATISLLLVAAFVRVWGPLGAALGVLCGAATGFCMHAAASQRVYRVPVEWQRLGVGCGVAALSVGSIWALASAGLTSLALRSVLCLGASLALVTVLSTRQERAWVRWRSKPSMSDDQDRTVSNLR